MSGPPSLRRKVNRLLLGIGLVAFLVSALVVTLLELSTQKQHLSRLMHGRVEVLRAVIERRLDEELERLGRLAEVLQVAEADEARLLLERAPALWGADDLLCLLGPRGKVEFAPAPYRHFVGLDFSHLGLAGAQGAVSSVHQSLFTRRSVVSLAQPLADGRALLLEKSLTGFAPLIEHVEQGEMVAGERQFVLSADGTVIYHPDFELVRSRHNLGLEISEPQLLDTAGMQRFRLRGRWVLGARDVLSRPAGWTVYYTLPLSRLTWVMVHGIAIQLLVVGLVLFLLFHALAWLLNRYFSAPLAEMVAALDGFDLHRQDDAIPCRSGRGILELERMIQAVNAMARKTRLATERLEAREEMFRTVTENAVNLAFWVRPDGGVRYITPSCERITGYRQAEFYQDPALLSGLIHPEERQLWANHVHEHTSAGEVMPLDFRIVTRHGEVRWLRHFCKPIIGAGGELLGHRSSNIDVTAQKAAEQQLVRNAFYDPLTGLANRSLFADRLEHLIRRLRREPIRFAVLYLDLDRFKVINDSLGHAVGDQLLVAVAAELQERCRPGDTVARLGGDEFAVLLEHVCGTEDALACAERLHQRMRRPFRLGAYEVFTTISVGVAESSPGYAKAADMLRDADTAMYQAKSSGRDRSAVFDTRMHTAAVTRLGLETDLRRALERGELENFYQPILQLPGGRICGFEALVRWRHPERGLIGPGEFIHIAEETGLILALGEGVLRAALAQLQQWQDRHPGLRPLTMNVNLSGLQLSQSGLLPLVRELLRQHPVDPASLNLEITETVLMEQAATVHGMLGELRALGVRLSMDDFGTGYSSLNYLRQFPFNCLKIERSFVGSMEQSQSDRQIVHTIVELAHNLGLDVVAEGVESSGQLALLEGFGCDYAQGFLFSRPVTADHAGAWLAPGHSAPSPERAAVRSGN